MPFPDFALSWLNPFNGDRSSTTGKNSPNDSVSSYDDSAEESEIPRATEDGIEFGLDVSGMSYTPQRDTNNGENWTLEEWKQENGSFTISDYNSDDDGSVVYIESTADNLNNITETPHRPRQVRLRRRDVTNVDGVESGFEPQSSFPRCQSTASLSIVGSQFQPRSLSCSQDQFVNESREPVRNPRVSSLSGISHYDSPKSRSASDFHVYGDKGIGPIADYDLGPGCCSTKTPQRHSVMQPSMHAQHGFGDIRQQGSSNRQVAVAPQPQRIEPSVNAARTHYVAPMQRKNSGGVLNNERLVDGVLPGREHEVSALNKRVKHLEKELNRLHRNQASGSSSFPHQYPASTRDSCYCGTHLDVLLAEKNRVIEALNDQLQREQHSYQQKIEELKHERVESRNELDRVVKKLDLLNHRYLAYDKALEEKYSQLEQDYMKLKQEFEQKNLLLEEAQRNCVRNEQTTMYVAGQNDRLQEILDGREQEIQSLTAEVRDLKFSMYEKEKKIFDQDSAITALSAEASSRVSSSSSSAPMACDDLDDSSSQTHYRQYKKATSSVGVRESGPITTNLRKSLSNFALNVAKEQMVTPTMSQDLRKARAVIADCRMLNVALKAALKTLHTRDSRSIPKVLMELEREDSEFVISDEEGADTDSRAMTVACAETFVSKTLTCVKDLEGDLTAIRGTISSLLEVAKESPLF